MWAKIIDKIVIKYKVHIWPVKLPASINMKFDNFLIRTSISISQRIII